MNTLTALVKFCEYVGVSTDAVDLCAEHDEIFICFEHEVSSFYDEHEDKLTKEGRFLEEMGFTYDYLNRGWSIYT